jgi:stage III sporulation protein AA
MGLIDVLSGYEKKEGIEMATRLFSPQVILCDEIGNDDESNALLSSCSGGCRVIASAHANNLSEARKIPFLEKLFQSGRFESAVTIRRFAGKDYQSLLQWEKIS